MFVFVIFILLFGCKQESQIVFYLKNKIITVDKVDLYISEGENVFIVIDKNTFKSNPLVFDSIMFLKDNKEFKISQRINGRIEKGNDFEVVIDSTTREITHYKCDNKIAFMISSKFKYSKYFDLKSLPLLPKCFNFTNQIR